MSARAASARLCLAFATVSARKVGMRLCANVFAADGTLRKTAAL